MSRIKDQPVTVTINTKAGKTEVFAIPKDRWIHHPNGDDIAAVSMEELSKDIYQLSDVPSEIYMIRGAAHMR